MTLTASPAPAATLESRVTALEARFRSADAPDLVAAMIGQVFGRRIALVSSFGTGSAVLLHMVAQADPATPVLFLDTGKHFGETRRYGDALIERLGLINCRQVQPDSSAVTMHDSDGVLWSRSPDHCCYIRKVAPLNRELTDFDAWFSGRRRELGVVRRDLSRIEVADGRIKINPLAGWTAGDIELYFATHDLPRHPLEAEGFLSVGCMTCTDRVAPGDDVRAGRWAGSEKTECGIHLTLLKQDDS